LAGFNAYENRQKIALATLPQVEQFAFFLTIMFALHIASTLGTKSCGCRLLERNGQEA
jgi:hypothetical protein